MTTVDAIYRNGTFEPLSRIELPDDCRVRLQIEPIEALRPEQEEAIREIHRIMGLRFETGEHDIAERHNEHQP
ncbi:MAG TPA: antitoxin family protein [Tepidisphaeraceae bacterium]|nr:antitoxin family protein [Tepidisphaeraceae bacterium]